MHTLVEQKRDGLALHDPGPDHIVEALGTDGELGELSDDVPSSVAEIGVALAFFDLGVATDEGGEGAGVGWEGGVWVCGVGGRFEGVEVGHETFAVEAEIADAGSGGGGVGVCAYEDAF